MANNIIGTQASTGPVRPTPTRSSPQPHWKTATRTPKAAPMDSRFIRIALSGITSERKAKASNRNDADITASSIHGSRAAVVSAESIPAAVAPVTHTCTPVAAAVAGRTELRSRWTRS
ncbi:hypothetical protein D1871_08245 [Nakamurella silvestris]|nr:hypothetical protein D1871_08245 [Nakamurella silvestris]